MKKAESLDEASKKQALASLLKAIEIAIEKAGTEAKTWTIPAERMKTDKEHVVPLSAEALDLAEPVYRFRDDKLNGLLAIGCHFCQVALDCSNSHFGRMRPQARPHQNRFAVLTLPNGEYSVPQRLRGVEHSPFGGIESAERIRRGLARPADCQNEYCWLD